MLSLIWNNISHRRAQSALTIAITTVTVLVFVLVLGVIQVMDQGLDLARQRLGADAMLIPKYAPTQSDELLFTAAPQNIYMKNEVYEQAKQLSGIAQMTPQFYAQTLDLSCCDTGEAVRIIGFDFATDFILAPYLQDRGITQLGERDLILGSSMYAGNLGGDYMMLSMMFHALAQLDVTGTGLDNTLFLDLDACRQLCLDSETLRKSWQERDPFDYISVIMIRFEEGVDPEAFVAQVQESGIDARCVLTSETISSLQSQLGVTRNVMLALWAACMLVAALALFGRFSSLARERRKEIGLLRAIGVKKRQVFALVSGECSLLAAIGGVLGAGVALLCMKQVIGLVADAFLLSASVWNSGLALLCGGGGVLLAVLLGFLSALVPAIRSAALDPQVAITQGEV